MKELGMALFGCLIFAGFFSTMIYPNLEYKGYPSTHNCTGECYEEYVRVHGTAVEQLKRQQAEAAEDPFSSIRGLWSGCAACHGNEGQGMAVFPALAGQSADYISSRLITYRNRGEVGSMSSTMWAQAGQLSDQEIETLSKFIEETMK